MQTIPGSAPVSTSYVLAGDLTPELDELAAARLAKTLFRALRKRRRHRAFARTSWSESSRWDGVPRVRGRQPEMTPQRTRAIHMKRKAIVVLENGSIVDELASADSCIRTLADCATGAGLVAGYLRRTLYPFPLENRRGQNRIHIPTTAHPPKWRLRSPHVRALGWILTGMVGLKKRAVVISHEQMGALIQLSGRQAGTIMRELCTWGLLQSRPIAKAKGCVTSFRACRYQLTRIALYAWAIRLPAACGHPSELPIGDYQELPPKRRRSKKSTPIAKPNLHGPLPLIRKEFPGTPDTSLREDSSGDRVTHRLAVSASRTFVFRTAVPDESAGRSQPETREGKTCDARSRLCKPESGDAGVELAERAGDALNRLQRIPPDPDSRDERGQPAPYMPPKKRVVPALDGRDRRERLQKLERDLERAERNSTRRISDRVDERVLEDEHGPGGRGDVAVDPSFEAEMRRIRESLADERRSFESDWSDERRAFEERRRAPKSSTDGITADDIESLWASFNRRRGRAADELPVETFKLVQKLRRDDGGENGGGK